MHSSNTQTSSKQIAANQANSQNSTGPVTDAGKNKIRFNAVKHGVCSKTLLLPSEDKAAFEALGESLLKIWHPSDELEFLKFGELHECYWRIERIRNAESNLLALGTREHYEQFADVEDPELRRGMAEAAAWRSNAKQFNMFRRHENALLREKENLERILSRLLELRVEKSKYRNHSAPRPNATLSKLRHPKMASFRTRLRKPLRPVAPASSGASAKENR